MTTLMKEVRSLERMRATHEAQAAGIRAHPDFRRVSDELDVEYEAARQVQMVRETGAGYGKR